MPLLASASNDIFFWMGDFQRGWNEGRNIRLAFVYPDVLHQLPYLKVHQKIRFCELRYCVEGHI